VGLGMPPVAHRVTGCSRWARASARPRETTGAPPTCATGARRAWRIDLRAASRARTRMEDKGVNRGGGHATGRARGHGVLAMGQGVRASA
jgi:hypothetical protein